MMGLTWPVQESDIANRLGSGVEIKPSALVILAFLYRPHSYDFYLCNFPPAFFFFSSSFSLLWVRK